jgi:ferulate-5-hydroxylase
VIFRAAFSARDNEGLDEFVVILQEFSKLMGLFHIGDFFPWLSWVGRRGFDRRLRTARGALDRFIDKIVDEHVRRGKDAADPDADLVDGLLAFLAEADPASGKHKEDAIRFTSHNVKAMIMVSTTVSLRSERDMPRFFSTVQHANYSVHDQKSTISIYL